MISVELSRSDSTHDETQGTSQFSQENSLYIPSQSQASDISSQMSSQEQKICIPFHKAAPSTQRNHINQVKKIIKSELDKYAEDSPIIWSIV